MALRAHESTIRGRKDHQEIACARRHHDDALFSTARARFAALATPTPALIDDSFRASLRGSPADQHSEKGRPAAAVRSRKAFSLVVYAVTKLRNYCIDQLLIRHIRYLMSELRPKTRLAKIFFE
jgi:hypothetical protein